MDHDVLLVLIGAAIALTSSLLTLAVSSRLWRSHSAGQGRSDGPESAEWTTRYVQTMREAMARNKAETGDDEPG